MAKRGRKGLYETHVKPNLSLIMEMRRTMTRKQIAESLGIGYSTFVQYEIDYPELADALKKGRQNLVAELRSSLIKRAHGYEYTEKKVTTEEVKWDDDVYATLIGIGLTPAQISKSKLVKTEVAHKQMAPDVAAINLALKNYDKEEWANDPQMLALKKEELELKKKQIEQNAW